MPGVRVIVLSIRNIVYVSIHDRICGRQRFMEILTLGSAGFVVACIGKITAPLRERFRLL